eukprot:5040989-Pyramimonas_sp.AAC.1
MPRGQPDAAQFATLARARPPLRPARLQLLKRLAQQQAEQIVVLSQRERERGGEDWAEKRSALQEAPALY